MNVADETRETCSRRELKTRVHELLAAPDEEESLRELRALPRPTVISSLLAELCNPAETIKWRAVAALGALTAELAEKDLEAGRGILRRLIWSLNEESGAMGWGAPEAMGEIMARHEALAREFAPILVSFIAPGPNFLGHPALLRGAVWGISRLAGARPELMKDAVPHLIERLNSPDQTTKELATQALKTLSEKSGALKPPREAPRR